MSQEQPTVTQFARMALHEAFGKPTDGMAETAGRNRLAWQAQIGLHLPWLSDRDLFSVYTLIGDLVSDAEAEADADPALDDPDFGLGYGEVGDDD